VTLLAVDNRIVLNVDKIGRIPDVTGKSLQAFGHKSRIQEKLKSFQSKCSNPDPGVRQSVVEPIVEPIVESNKEPVEQIKSDTKIILWDTYGKEILACMNAMRMTNPEKKYFGSVKDFEMICQAICRDKLMGKGKSMKRYFYKVLDKLQKPNIGTNVKYMEMATACSIDFYEWLLKWATSRSA